MPKRIVKDYVNNIRLFSTNARFFLGGSFFMGFYMAIYWTMLNLYFKQLGLNEGTIGMINSCGALGTAIIAIPAAVIIDHVRIKNAMMFAAMITAIADICLVLVQPVWLICLFSAIAGAMVNLHFVAVSPFFMRNSTQTERTYLYGVNNALDMTAGFFGALIGGYIPHFVVNNGLSILTGYRIAFMVGAAMAFVAISFYARIDSPLPIRSGKIKLRDYISARDWGTTFKLCTPNILVGLGAGFTIPFINLYFSSRFSLDSAAIGKLFSVGQLFTVIGFLAGPAIAKKIGLVKTVGFSQLASIPFFMVLAFNYNLAPVAIAFWFRGSLMNMSSPLYNNFAMEKTEPEHHAGTNSLLALSWSASWMVSTYLGGRLIEHHGFEPVMIATIGLYLISSIAVFIFFRKSMEIGKAAKTDISFQ
jgi:MFS family permease